MPSARTHCVSPTLHVPDACADHVPPHYAERAMVHGVIGGYDQFRKGSCKPCDAYLVKKRHWGS